MKNKKLDVSESNENNPQGPYRYADHKKPVTRRDFLATGAIGISAMAFTSGATALLSSDNLYGAAMSCGTNLLCGNVPFLCVDGAGGMNIAGGNVIVGFDKNQFQEDFASNNLSDYRRLGIPDIYHPSKTGMVNNSYGLKFHSTSGILEGLEEVLAPRTGETNDLREHVDGLLLCAITSDDTTGNPLNTSYMAQRAGAVGDLVQLIGNGGSVAGGNSTAPSDQVDLTKKPSRLSNFKDSESLLSIGDSLVSGRFLASTAADGGSRMKSFMGLVARAGRGRLNELKKDPKIAAEIESYSTKQGKITEVFDKFSPSELNPATNATDRTIVQNVYGVTNLNMINGSDQATANIINLLTKRTAGAGTITVGGCDYHNGTAMTGHMKDKEIGRHIGHAIRMDAARGVPMFIHLFTDGGVTADIAGQIDLNLPSRVVWRSDSGERSAAMMLVFHPTKKRVSDGQKAEHSNFILAGKTRQIGYFKAAGGVITDAHSLSNNTQKLWVAVILNYMATLVNSTDDDKIVAEVGERFREKFGSLPNDWQQLIRLKSLIA